MDTLTQIVHELKQHGFIHHVVHRTSDWFHEQKLLHKEKPPAKTQVAHTGHNPAFHPKVLAVLKDAMKW